EQRIDTSDLELRYYELALKVSGAVQARRWTALADGGFIHSFNGAHSLFVDTMRSLRTLALAFLLGQTLREAQDAEVNLLVRLVAAHETAAYYMEIAASDGVPYWDAGAPGLAALPGWPERPANPFNEHEPVDSSAAVVAAQGLLRLAHFLSRRGEDVSRYEQ